MMMTADVEKFHFRLVLLGSLGTGKTSILNRFLFKKFETKYKPTVEDLFSQDFDLGSIVIKVDFLDTSGSMQFPAMRRLSLTTGSAFLMVYAIDDENSYEVLKICMQELQEVRPDFQEIPIVFAGNKCDQARDGRKVSKEVVSNYVHYELPRLRAKVIECSCRDNINIDNIFRAYMSLAKVTLSTAVSAGLRATGSGSSLARASPTAAPLASSFSAATPAAAGTSSPSHAAVAKQQQDTANSSCASDSTSATPTGSQPSTPTNKQPPAEQHQHPLARYPSSSIKMGLSVRKSCDASIVSPRRSTFFGVGQQSAAAGAATNTDKQTPGGGRHTGSGRTSSASTPTQGEPADNNYNSPEEFNLEMAIQSKLSVNERPKPRSRSLIWRPSRTKSTRSNASALNNGSDCRVT